MHLSDLHLGKVILEQSMIDDQKYILEQIIKIIKDKEVEVILIAGDIYDKGIPNVEAVRLFSNFLARLYENRIKVFVISGNHDSKDRLIFGNELFIDNGVYIEGIYNGVLKKIELADEFGKILIYMLPFIKPADVRGFYPDMEIDSYQDAVKCIIDNTDIDVSKRNIIMVHQFVTANGIEIERSDSESLSLGGIDNIDVSLFDQFDYVAMGHVHGAQKLIRDTVRYAGSPLKYSFSEVHQRKCVPILDFKEKGKIDIELVDLVPLRDMRVIKGRLEQLLDDEVVALGNTDDYINAIITDDDYIMDAIGKLRRFYKNILRLEYQNKRNSVLEKGSQLFSDNVEKKSEIELFEEFYEKQNGIKLEKERFEIVNKVIKELIDIKE